jgi:hypothetical protein
MRFARGQQGSSCHHRRTDCLLPEHATFTGFGARSPPRHSSITYAVVYNAPFFMCLLHIVYCMLYYSLFACAPQIMLIITGFFNWKPFFYPAMHSISLYFSMRGRIKRFVAICIDNNDEAHASKPQHQLPTTTTKTTTYNTNKMTTTTTISTTTTTPCSNTSNNNIMNQQQRRRGNANNIHTNHSLRWSGHFSNNRWLRCLTKLAQHSLTRVGASCRQLSHTTIVWCCWLHVVVVD